MSSRSTQPREEVIVISATRTVQETYGENESLVALLQAHEGAGNRVFGVFCLQVVETVRSKTAVSSTEHKSTSKPVEGFILRAWFAYGKSRDTSEHKQTHSKSGTPGGKVTVDS